MTVDELLRSLEDSDDSGSEDSDFSDGVGAYGSAFDDDDLMDMETTLTPHDTSLPDSSNEDEEDDHSRDHSEETSRAPGRARQWNMDEPTSMSWPTTKPPGSNSHR